jgi:integrase
MRIAEARAVRWEDIGDGYITVTGGEGGTKNHEHRRVPIIGPMAALLDLMRPDVAKGPVWSILTPRIALQGACQRLRLPHVRVHDLRHLFATACIESGVDIPTLSRWLGHKDGGVLALKTYGHLRDEHSQQQAAKVRF